MQSKIKIPKQLPFKQVKPYKFMGINSQLPFNSIISQSKLLYFSGRSLILQNIKTYQQKIVWTNEYENSPEMIEHIKDSHRQNIVGIAVCDQSSNHVVIILKINSIINNYEHLSAKQKSKDKLHYLKNINQDEKIEKIKFLNDGVMFAIVVTEKESQKQNSHKDIRIYSSLTGDCMYSCNYKAKNPLIEAVLMNRHNYACIIKNVAQKQDEDQFFYPKNQFSNIKSQINLKTYFIVDLLILSELSCKNQLFLELEQNQCIIQVKFVSDHKKIIAFFLLNSGFILACMFNQRGFHQQIRIDVRINKKEHQKKVKNKNKQTVNLEKFEINDNVMDFEEQNFEEKSKHNQNHARGTKRYHSNQPTKPQQLLQQKPQIRKKKIKMENLKAQKNGIKYQNQKSTENKYFLPCCISYSSNKVVIGYEGCPFIGLIQYSGVDHRQYKFWYIDDFFIKRPEIESIRKIDFSEDGCHCSVLVKLCSTDKNIKLDKVNESSSTKDLISDSSPQYFHLLQIDFVSGLIQHSYHNESIQQSLTCYSLNGNVDCVEFIFKNNTVFLMMSDNRLCYCTMNINRLMKNDALSQNNFIINSNKAVEKKQGFGKKQVLSESMLLWTDKVKTKPYLIISHPIVFQIVLVYQDNIKFHFYNYNQLFEHHHTFSLKNCKAASYSPYGDKLALGTLGSIWIMDSYTYSIVKTISLVIFPTEVINKLPQCKQQRKQHNRSASVFTTLSAKTVSKIQYISNDDIMIQTGNTTLSILLNYQKVLFFGYTSQAIHGHLFFYDNKHNHGVIASQDCVKVITKCSINSKNKCEQLAKIDIIITAIKLCGEIDILFLGGKNGILYFVRWPDFFQNKTIKYPTLNNRLYLFHSAIIDVQITVNYKQLFVTSEQGMMIICDLVHSDDVEKIGKDVSFRMSKKIDFKLSLLNKWLVSTSDCEKRAQNVTKLMGNEAEIKINQNNFTEEYKQNLQTQLQELKASLSQKLKDEIKKYEIDTGISKLLVDIVLMRDQIITISGKRQVQSKQINEKIDMDLHKIFIQKQKLQKQLEEVKIKCQQEKQSVVKNLQKIAAQKDENNISTVDQVKGMENESLNYYTEKMEMDLGLQENMKQDFEDEFNQAKIFYGEQFTQILQKNNVLSQQNRRMKVQMIDMREKMREFSARMEEIQNDVSEIEKQRHQFDNTKSQLSQEIIQTDKKYHQLIKRTKQLQTTLNKTRTSSQACQMRYDELEKEMQILQDNWNYLQKKAGENSNDFVEQYNLRNVGMGQQQQLKQKIIKLKQKRKQLFQKTVLLKDLLKPYEIEYPDYLQSDSNLDQFSTQSLQYKKSKAIKLTSDVDKWTNFKDQSKLRMIKHNGKLQQQTNKLLFRFNQLMKQHKDLMNMQNNLKQTIKVQRQKINYSMTSTSNWEKFSFVPIPQEKQQEYQSSKKINTRKFLSINRQSQTRNDGKDKLNSTSCHFTSSHSVSRDNKINKYIDRPLTMLKFKEKHANNNEPSTKLSKVSSKNLQSLIYQKKATLKQQLKKQSSNNSLYYGVTIDPQTLKPNKTLCISLHKEGNQTKFVTQY